MNTNETATGESATPASDTDQSPSDTATRSANDRLRGEANTRYLLVLALLPIGGYTILLPYAVILYGLLGPEAHPLLLLGIPELLLGFCYVYCIHRDQRQLTKAGAVWNAAGWFWYPMAFLVGGTVLGGPLVSILYLKQRRRQVGAPARGWFQIVRTREIE